MGSLNKALIIGKLGAAPEKHQGQSGNSIVTLRVATDESYKDAAGNKVEQTEWHKIVVFGRTADFCSQYLHKGSQVYIEGKLNTRKWQDQNGQDRYTTEIKADRVQLLDRREQTVTPAIVPAPAQLPDRRQQYQASLDEDIPF